MMLWIETGKIGLLIGDILFGVAALAVVAIAGAALYFSHKHKQA